MSTVAIAGAGLVGRLFAWRFSRLGHEVRVVDPAPGPDAPPTGRVDTVSDHAAAFTAAGMLSPWAELDHAEPALARLGRRSLHQWPAIAQQLGGGAESLVRRDGSLLVAHRGDGGAALRQLARIEGGAVEAFGAARTGARRLDADALRELEPALAPGLSGWWLPEEGRVLPREMMEMLVRRSPEVTWHWNACATAVRPGEIVLGDGRVLKADLVVDARGLGARADAAFAAPAGAGENAGPALRGVRGEVVWLHAPGVPLRRPVRLMHPRHRVYLVPRPGDLVVVGASEIESEDRGPVSLRTAVELMAAAHSVVPALAEARVVHLESNLRPATPDHRPHVHREPGLLRVNGLFRHGWLVAPALVDDVLTGLYGEPARLPAFVATKEGGDARVPA